MSLETPSYVLGQSTNAERRLALLDELTAPRFVQAMDGLPNRGVRVLNIGCGSGHFEARLSTIFSDSHFIGIDISAQRIEEFRVRTGALHDSNSYEGIQADLTGLSLEELGEFDILIFRFVLTHLSQPLEQFERFSSLVREGGYVCFEEAASDASEYFCNTDNRGYREWVKLTKVQSQLQQSSFDVGFRLLSNLLQQSCEVIQSYISQGVLSNMERKSICRLGIEDSKLLGGDGMDETIRSLRAFEEDPLSFGLYTRTLSVVAIKTGKSTQCSEY